jgi:hypothetical protein
MKYTKTTPKNLRTKARTYQRGFDKKWRAFEDWLIARFAFAHRWRVAVGKQLTRLGHVIARISPPWLRRTGRVVWSPFAYMLQKTGSLMGRRPHRSFRLTRRRDYKRSLNLPGYWSFTNSVRAMLWKNWRLFGGLVLVYLTLSFVFNSFGQQQAYQNLSDVLNSTGDQLFQGNMGKVAASGLLLFTSVTTGLTPDVTAAQTVLGWLTVFYTWLATVWALRNVMAGRKVGVRDAVYSSGSPVISTFLTSLVLVVQVLPLSIAILIYNAAITTELINGAEAMVAWIGVMLLTLMSLYWMTSTAIALVVVTLPGMYPWQAIRTAGDLVVGRRLRIVFRLLWLALTVVATWAIVLIPIILFDDWIKKVWTVIGGVPIVPVCILAMTSVTIVFSAAYIYLLYRKVVDDDAKPA